MITPKEAVHEGYKTLAKRTIDALLKSDIHTQVHCFNCIETTRQYLEDLQKLRDCGDIEVLKPRLTNLSTIITLCDNGIPDDLKPFEEQEMIDFVMSGVNCYFKFSSNEELLDKAGISEIYFDTGYCGIQEHFNADGSINQVFFATTNQITPSIAIISNSHPFYHAIKKDTSKIAEILKEVKSVKGFEEFDFALREHPILFTRYQQTILNKNALHFLKQKDILQLAKEFGIDTKILEKKLEDLTSEADFYSCLNNGQGFISQTDILHTNPNLQNNQSALNFYLLISLTDTLFNAFSPPCPTVFKVGIGIAQYLQTNPKQKTKLVESKEFHKELSREYFS